MRRPTTNEGKPELKPRHMEALAEVARYRSDSPFWWRRASMADLAAHGLVEEWKPALLANSKRKTLPYRITLAGQAALAKRENEDA